MSTRWEVERAVYESEMKPLRRLLALALLSLTDPKTAVIPAEYTPSLTRLEQMTGMVRSTVTKELNGLEADGWVVRKRPPVAKARAEKARTKYRLQVPPASPSHGPVKAELVRHTDHKASPSHGLASPSHGLVLNLLPTSSSSSANGTAVLDRIAVALSIEEEEAKKVFNRITTERRPIAPSRYIDELIANGDIAQFRTTTRPAAPYTGTRCSYVDPGDNTGLCATCGMPTAHARHGDPS